MLKKFVLTKLFSFLFFRNMVKLSLYRHFTNTLIFSVIASVIFMLYALRLRKAENCTPVSFFKELYICLFFLLYNDFLLLGLA